MSEQSTMPGGNKASAVLRASHKLPSPNKTRGQCRGETVARISISTIDHSPHSTQNDINNFGPISK